MAAKQTAEAISGEVTLTGQTRIGAFNIWETFDPSKRKTPNSRLYN